MWCFIGCVSALTQTNTGRGRSNFPVEPSNECASINLGANGGYCRAGTERDANNTCLGREHSLSSIQFHSQPQSLIVLMSRNCTVFVGFVVTFFFLSCNQSFDSKAPFQSQLVVFSVLSTDRTSQVVRVEGDYMPAGYDPLSSTADVAVRTAVVTLRDGLTTYRLRDTVMDRQDTTRYKSLLHAFVANPLAAQPGRTYVVTVQAPGYSSASATATIPGRSYPGTGVTTLLVLDYPRGYEDNADIICNALLSTATKGYVGRLFADYEVLIGTEWVEGRVEIPMGFIDPKVPDLKYVKYPQLTSRTASQMVISFKNGVYKAVLQSLTSGRYKSNKLIFKWVVFQFLQTEKNLFNYYNTTHAFRDAQSIRLDEPLFSNVSGGFGVVGAYTLDSLVHLLPEDFSYNNK